jgi:hypothetical protein
VERTEGRTYVSIDAEVEFDLLVSMPRLSNIFERRTFTLPTDDAPGSVQEPNYSDQPESVHTVKRVVPIVVSLAGETQPWSDLKIEQCMV